MKLTDDKGVALIHYIIIVISILIIIFSIGFIYWSNNKSNKNTNTSLNSYGNINNEYPSESDNYGIVEFMFKKNKNEDRALIKKSTDYNVYDLGGTTNVIVNGESFTLKEAFENDKLSIADIISQIVYDEKSEKCTLSFYSFDRIYKYNDYSVVITDTCNENYTTTCHPVIIFSRNDLDLTSNKYTYPLFSSGYKYNDDDMAPFFQSIDYTSNDIITNFTKEDAIKIKQVAKTDNYSLVTFGGEVEFVIDGTNYKLDDTIDGKEIESEILKQLDIDSYYGRCSTNYLIKSGNYREYVYEDKTILVANKLTVKNPEIVFTLPEKNLSDDSNISDIYFSTKMAGYTGSDYNKGLGMDCELEEKLDDNIWLVSVKVMNDEEIKQYIKEERITLVDPDDEFSLKLINETALENSFNKYLIDLSSASNVDRDVNVGDTISIVYSGNPGGKLNSYTTSNDENDSEDIMTLYNASIDDADTNELFIVDKELIPNKCYIFKRINKDGTPLKFSLILFLKDNVIIKDNALDEGSLFKCDSNHYLDYSANGYYDAYYYIGDIITVEKAK